MVRLAALSLLLGVIATQAIAGQAPANPPASFLLRTSEWHTTMTPIAGPNNVGNCMIVNRDGRLHLELRRQEFFNGKASLVSYEGKLSTAELTSLRAVLTADSIKSRPAFHEPKTPLQADHFESFIAEIPRGAKTQTVGTFSWHGLGPTDADAEIREWREAALALEPLMEWSHRIKSLGPPGLRIVPSANSVCGR